MALKGYKPKWKKRLDLRDKPQDRTVTAKQMLDKLTKVFGKPPKRIAPRTKKRASEEAKYRRRVKVWLVGKTCGQGYCKAPATECHHRNGRAGKLLLHEPFWLPVCNFHHHWITNYPSQARQLGLICELGKWNDQKEAL